MASTVTGEPQSGPLGGLLDRARMGDEVAREMVTDRLRRSLTTMVRLAVRRGAGLPPLVTWVRQTCDAMSAGGKATPDPRAPEITQMLCATLMRRLLSVPPAQLRDTVLGA